MPTEETRNRGSRPSTTPGVRIGTRGVKQPLWLNSSCRKCPGRNSVFSRGGKTQIKTSGDGN